jgi:hypothetical protein
VPEAIEPAKKTPKRTTLGSYAALGAVLSGVLVGGLALRHATHDTAPSSLHHGSAGVKHTQKGADVRWRRGQTTVYLDSSLDNLGEDARTAIQSAFATWSIADPELPQLEFERTHKAVLTAKPDGKNTVLVAPITVKGHEHDLAITLTYSDEETGDIVEADIIINSEYPFRTLKSDDDGLGSQAQSQNDDDAHKTVTGDNGLQTTVSAARASCTAMAQRASCEGNSYDLQNVVTHEVGHFYGLGEDMEDSATTMYYCTSRCETHKRVLTVSDTQVMTSLYVAPNSDSSGPQAGCSGARVAPHGGLAEAGWAALLGLFALVRRRRSSPNSAR